MAICYFSSSDVEDGGETVFPLAKAKRRSSLFLFKLFAKKGMSVKPKMGDALLFWNIKPDGSHYYRKHFPRRSKSVFRGR